MIDPGTTPSPRRLSDQSTEQFAEVCLVDEAALEGNVGERRLRRQHEALGMFNASPQNISVRGISEALSERAAEVERTEPRNRCQILGDDSAA